MASADVRPVSELFDPSLWREVAGFTTLTDVTYHRDVTEIGRAHV